VVSATWDGVTRGASLTGSAAALRHVLADHARRFDWHGVFIMLSEHPYLVNCWRPDGRSWFAPLHQVACGGAPLEVARQLIGRGAWRALRSADGERPVDVAARLAHGHLVDVLAPSVRSVVEHDVLAAIQVRFHEVIRTRAARFVEEQRLRLPELEVLLELDEPEMWFPVPGMYGGFQYGLVTDAGGARLVSESWIRVVGGSRQRHEITPDRATLTDEGFV
jgi:hypothetical protein